MDHDFVIPAYGRPPHLQSCIDSLLNQSVGRPSITIATSTPSGYLEEIADRNRVALQVNPSRADIATDWNFALHSSGAARVTIAHQDDIYDTSYLQTMLVQARTHPRFLIAFSDYREHTNQGERSANLNLRVKRWLCARAFGGRETLDSRRTKLRLLNLGNPVCCPSVMFNRQRLPDFQFNAALKTNLDWDAWARLADVDGDFLYIRRKLVSKRVHAGSETSITIANRIRQREDREMFERFWPKPLAALISMIYAAGYWSNQT
jgi:hypothetical protein